MTLFRRLQKTLDFLQTENSPLARFVMRLVFSKTRVDDDELIFDGFSEDLAQGSKNELPSAGADVLSESVEQLSHVPALDTTKVKPSKQRDDMLADKAFIQLVGLIAPRLTDVCNPRFQIRSQSRLSIHKAPAGPSRKSGKNQEPER